jgi:hypothetical protein
VDSQALVDRLTITDVLHRYAFGIDGKDWAMFRQLFTDDAVGDYGEYGLLEGGDRITEFMETGHVGITTQHAIMNVVVELDGDQAAAVSYFIATLRPGDDPFRRVGGRYDDGLVRTGVGYGWKIRRRAVTFFWSEGPRAHWRDADPRSRAGS